MTVISKLASRVVLPFCRANALGKLRPVSATIISIRNGGHGHTFQKRQSQLYTNRMLDAAMFYFVGLALIPGTLLYIFVYVYYGPCVLQEYPKEGPPPRYWQFERTVLRQWGARIKGPHEKWLEENQTELEAEGIIRRWNQVMERVKHLQNERWDYKGYYYKPVSAAWVDYARHVHDRLHHQYEMHGHHRS
ncbi:NADH:ubiquinone oxidoreductase, NDUFB5/SGDH subunit domain-containing protein [Ditylenchus destructor]|nr:NADH:ubiquinone oxidoreductase, NDUFB5/SGDH subunit domain-containing protein [Ditylenchus destructor]